MTLDTATGAHALTDQQQAILDAVASGRQTVVVKALAGTGKTSTLAAVARHLQETQPDKRLLYLAFNKVTADEAKSRMPSNVEALTSNAMAHRAVPQHISRRMNPRAIKARDLIEQVGIKRDVYVGSHRLASPYDLARLALRTMERWCQSAAPAPARAHVPAPSPGDGSDVHRTMELISYEASKGCATTGAEELAMEQALESAWSTVVERVLRIVNAWWERVVDPSGTIQVSFDQEVKFWALSGVRFDQAGSGSRAPMDIVLLDEAQDTNHVLGALVAAQPIQQVYVGDRNQQIYSWRGSVDFLDAVDSGDALSLTASWRFGPQIAHHANAFLALIGTSERVLGNGPQANLGPISQPDAIVCRTNAGLLNAAVEMDGAGRKVGVPKGMKFDLKILAETVAWLRDGARRPMLVHEDLREFGDWSQVMKEADNDQSGPVARLVKLVADLSMPALLALVERLVDVDQASKGRPTWDVVVTTAHKAKGLEWDSVRIADDFPQPRTDDDGKLVLPDDENLRLAYVSVTRAKRALDIGSLAYAAPLAGVGAPPAPARAPERPVELLEVPEEPPATAAAAGGGDGDASGADLRSMLEAATGHSDATVEELLAALEEQVRLAERTKVADELATYAERNDNPGVRLASVYVRSSARALARAASRDRA